jgi:hypothetical protein
LNLRPLACEARAGGCGLYQRVTPILCWTRSHVSTCPPEPPRTSPIVVRSWSTPPWVQEPSRPDYTGSHREDPTEPNSGRSPEIAPPAPLTPHGAERAPRQPLSLFRFAFVFAALLRFDTRRLSSLLFQLPPRNPAPSRKPATPFSVPHAGGPTAYPGAEGVFSAPDGGGRTADRISYRRPGRPTLIEPLQRRRQRAGPSSTSPATQHPTHPQQLPHHVLPRAVVHEPQVLRQAQQVPQHVKP